MLESSVKLIDTGKRIRITSFLGITRDIDIEGVKGVWSAPAWSFRHIDRGLFGAAFINAGGCATHITGSHMRLPDEGSDAREKGESVADLLKELKELNPDWNPRKVSGYAFYRLILTVACVFWACYVIPATVIRLFAAPSDLTSLAWLFLAVFMIPAMRLLWKLTAIFQIRYLRRDFWR